MNERASIILKKLVEQYILSGDPVSSSWLSKSCDLHLSSATVRSVISNIEKNGYVFSPHISAGRIPTSKGYRFFVDELLHTSYHYEDDISKTMARYLTFETVEKLMRSTAQFLSEFSSFASFVRVPRREFDEICHVELLRISSHRLLLILVTNDGSVENRLIDVTHDYSSDQLTEAMNFINRYCVRQSLKTMQENLCQELRKIRGDIEELLLKTIEFSRHFVEHNNDRYLINGEKNLLSVSDFSQNINRIKDLFDLFEKRTLLAGLLDSSVHYPGINVLVGDESGIPSLSDCSLVVSPYSCCGRYLGILGVIGPVRMPYRRIISLVNVASRSLSRIYQRMFLGEYEV